MSRLYMMVTITDWNRKKKFEEFYKKNEHMVFFTTLGRGTANSEMLDYFGLEESEKVVILSVVTEETWKKLRREMIVKMQIDVPGTGIAFIVPLSSIGGEKTLHFLIQSEKFEREEESTLKETEYELLVAIANQGCIDTVMDVARSVGAGGGTVIHAKGTGMETAEKFLGVSLAAEKEIILIVTRKKQKNAIMKAMMEQTGLASKEKTIIFSLPVTSTVGLRMYIDEMDMDEEEEYQIVGSAEADPMENRISDESPMGKGLIGGRINEEIDIEIPAGMMRLKILEISK